MCLAWESRKQSPVMMVEFTADQNFADANKRAPPTVTALPRRLWEQIDFPAPVAHYLRQRFEAPDFSLDKQYFMSISTRNGNPGQVLETKFYGDLDRVVSEELNKAKLAATTSGQRDEIDARIAAHTQTLSDSPASGVREAEQHFQDAAASLTDNGLNTRCRLQGLSGAAHLNGQDGDISGHDARGRVIVHLDDGTKVHQHTYNPTLTPDSGKYENCILAIVPSATVTLSHSILRAYYLLLSRLTSHPVLRHHAHVQVSVKAENCVQLSTRVRLTGLGSAPHLNGQEVRPRDCPVYIPAGVGRC